MSGFLITTPVELGKCVRCQAYVFACHVGGVQTAVDPTPLDPVSYREALIAGRTTYRIIEQAGRPWKLRQEHPSVESKGAVVASHNCGTKAMNTAAVEVVPTDPHRAPAKLGNPTGGNRPGIAPEKLEQGPEVVGRANRPLSRPWPCAICRKIIGRDEPRMQIEMPVEYTRTVKIKANKREGIEAHSYDVQEVGTKTWAIHADECPG